MHITTLPSDVRVLILSHLDFPSLSRLVQSHSSFNSVWKSYPEHLSRAICIRNGLADAKTIGSAAPLQLEGWQEKKGLDQDPNEEELKQVIREQRSLNKVFDHVEDWTSYGQFRGFAHLRRIAAHFVSFSLFDSQNSLDHRSQLEHWQDEAIPNQVRHEGSTSSWITRHGGVLEIQGRPCIGLDYRHGTLWWSVRVRNGWQTIVVLNPSRRSIWSPRIDLLFGRQFDFLPFDHSD